MSHLSISERLKIEHYLREWKNFQEIAEHLRKARSTIVREVKKHRIKNLKVGYHRIQNRCIHRRDCNPYSAYQKGDVENNHLNLRRIFVRLNAQFLRSLCVYSDKRAFTLRIDNS